MIKKITLASLFAVAAINTAHANVAPYIGASVGVINNSENVKFNGVTSSGGSFRGIPFNLFAGYGGLMTNCVYLAGELFGTVSTANISDNTNMKSSRSIGLGILPGFMVNDRTLAYARAGIVNTRFTAGNENRNGGQLGLGLQTSLTQNIDLRGEYAFTAYESKNVTNAGMTNSVAPRQDQATVGLVYKFD